MLAILHTWYTLRRYVSTNRYIFAVEIIVPFPYYKYTHIVGYIIPIAYTLKEKQQQKKNSSIFRHFAFPFIKPKHRRRTLNVSLYDANPFAK